MGVAGHQLCDRLGRIIERIRMRHANLQFAGLGLAKELQAGRGPDLGSRISARAGTYDLEAEIDTVLESGDRDDPITIGHEGHRDESTASSVPTVSMATSTP